MLRNMRFAIPVFALVVLFMFIAPPQASARVHFGVYVGPSVYPYPYTYPYAYSYSYPYAYNYYTYPYPYGYRVYSYPRYSWGHARHEWREHREHEYREHHRR